MNRSVLAALLLAAASPAAHAQQRQEPLRLTAPAEIEDAQALNAGIDRISGKVTACVERGGEPDACMCREAADIAALKRAYEAAVAKHPDWRGRILHFSNAENTYSANINMPGLAGAFGGCP
jgi:hypothetical protein